jgi:hypothetical protein
LLTAARAALSDRTAVTLPYGLLQELPAELTA